MKPSKTPGSLVLRDRIILLILLTGAFLSPFDYFIVNLALPAIRSGLHTGTADQQLIISAYASAFAALLVTGGRLGDLVGRRKMFLTGIAGFTVSSVFCACAFNGWSLIAGRAFQGAFAAIMTPQVVAFIKVIFNAEQQGRIMGLYSFVFGTASVAGQLIGGLLIAVHPFGISWPSIFLINVPVGIIAFWGGWRYLPENKARSDEKIDYLGVLLLSLSLFLLIYSLSRGREQGWPSSTIFLLAASIFVLMLFVRTQVGLKRKGGSPLVDFQFFRNRNFSIGLLLAFCFYWDSAFFLIFGIFVQNGLEWDALRSGLAILPFGVGAIAGALLSGFIQQTPARLLCYGFTLLTVGFAFAALRLYNHGNPELIFYISLAIAGTGHGITLPSVTRLVVGQVSAQKAGMASGMTASTLQIGSAFGATFVGGIFLSLTAGNAGKPGYLRAFFLSLILLACLYCLCVVISLIVGRK